MQIPARTLRARARDVPGRPTRYLSVKEQDRADILTVSRTLIAEYGRHNLTMANLAIALELSPAMIRRHFPDLDALLATLLSDHLMALAQAIGAIPAGAPNRAAAARAAYYAHTRGAFGGLTPDHLLLTRERHLLPAEEAAEIGALRDGIGQMIAPEDVFTVLNLLDLPYVTLPQIEAMIEAAASRPARRLHPGPHIAPRANPPPTPAPPRRAPLPPDWPLSPNPLAIIPDTILRPSKRLPTTAH